MPATVVATMRGAHVKVWSMLAGLLLLAAASTGALAQTTLKFPALTGRVVDAANILPPVEREKITRKLEAYEQKTSDQVVVATVPSLQETSIEDFSNQLFRTWKLGQAKTNNGVLLLIAPNDRKVRIEVGYGLEGSLTDAMSKLIIAAAIAPKFKAGDFAGGIDTGLDAIISILQKDGEWQDRLKLRNASPDEGYDPMAILFAIILIIIVFRIIAAQPRGLSGGTAHRTRNGGWITMPPSSSGWGGGWGGGSSGGGGGFSGGGGSSGGGGASGSW